jgi:hypothetical protein
VVYEQIASRMTEELNRFQKERAAEVAALLRGFAVAQVGSREGMGHSDPFSILAA